MTRGRMPAAPYRLATGAGPALRRLRMAKGISMADVAKVAGWSTSRLSLYERGATRASTEALAVLALAIGTTAEALTLYCLHAIMPKILEDPQVSVDAAALVRLVERH